MSLPRDLGSRAYAPAVASAIGHTPPAGGAPCIVSLCADAKTATFVTGSAWRGAPAYGTSDGLHCPSMHARPVAQSDAAFWQGYAHRPTCKLQRWVPHVVSLLHWMHSRGLLRLRRRRAAGLGGLSGWCSHTPDRAAAVRRGGCRTGRRPAPDPVAAACAHKRRAPGHNPECPAATRSGGSPGVRLLGCPR